MDRLEMWLEKREPHATLALSIYHQEALANGEPPSDLRDRIDRIKAVLFISARKDPKYRVLFDRKFAASVTPDITAAELDRLPREAKKAALDAAERVLRSDRLCLPARSGKPVSIASRIKTAMRAAMRQVRLAHGIPDELVTVEDEAPAPRTRLDVPDYWDNEDDGESRSASKVGRLGGRRNAQARRSFDPLPRPALTPEDRTAGRVTAEELERYRAMLSQRDAMERGFARWADSARSRGLDPRDARFLDIAHQAAQAAQVFPGDSFDVAFALAAQGRLAESASLLSGSGADAMSDFKRQSLVALSGPAASAEPSLPNLVVLQGRREDRWAKDNLSAVDYAIWQHRNDGRGSVDHHRKQLAAAGVCELTAEDYRQHRSRAAKQVRDAMSRVDVATAVTERQFAPEAETSSAG